MDVPAPEASAGGVLAIDVGNLLTCIVVWHGETATHHFQAGTDPRRTVDECALLIERWLRAVGIHPPALSGAVISCVVPVLGEVTASACERMLGRPPLVVGPGTRTGLSIRTDDPREVGADRIANAVAARERFGAPVVIVDFATALSIDVVNDAGQYVGAIIAPGIEVAAEALARRAAQLRRIPLVAPPHVIGDSTAHSLQSGLVLGCAALVDGLVERVQAEWGPAAVVATGESGAAPEIVRLCRAIHHFDPLLTLDGLARLFRASIEHPSPVRRSGG